MEFLGIGPLELLLILLLALIVLGPKDIEKTAKNLGKGLNKLVRSDTWKAVTNASHELRTLPNKLMREANLDELKEMTTQNLATPITDAKQALKTWTNASDGLHESPGEPPMAVDAPSGETLVLQEPGEPSPDEKEPDA